MPQVGEIKKAKELNRKYWDKYIWLSCPRCNVERWIRCDVWKKIGGSPLCSSCSTKQNWDAGSYGDRQTHEHRKLVARNWYAKNREHLNERARVFYWAHRAELKSKYIKKSLELKIGVLKHYGNEKCACVKCGESRLACLSIDHILGNGTKHRKV